MAEVECSLKLLLRLHEYGAHRSLYGFFLALLGERLDGYDDTLLQSILCLTIIKAFQPIFHRSILPRTRCYVMRT